MTVNYAAESSNITKFEIFFKEGSNPLDVSGAISQLYIYQSLLDWTPRVSATFADVGNRIGQEGKAALEKNDLNLTASEKVYLVIKDVYQNKIAFENDYELRIKETRDIVEHTQKTSYTIDLFSKESITNMLNDYNVKKRYSGKISDTVKTILSEVLKTPKNIVVDQGLNKLEVHPHIGRPFDLCTWLCPRCIPEGVSNADGIRAGYFFYEVVDDGSGNGGYRFKSIDKLLTENPKKKFVFNNTTSLPSGYDAKILDYSFDSTVDVFRKLQMGALHAETRTFDPYSHDFNEPLFAAEKQFEDEDTIAGKEKIPFADDLNLWDSPSIIRVAFKDIGSLPPGTTLKKQLEKSKDYENYPVEKIQPQACARYNNLFSVKLSIGIPGDFSLKPGDLVHCDFPEISNSEDSAVSDKKSGIYMIVDICHSVNPKTTWTRMNLVRESIYRKPM